MDEDERSICFSCGLGPLRVNVQAISNLHANFDGVLQKMIDYVS